MRKFYSFISVFALSLILLQAKAQNDVTNLTSPVSVNNVAADNSTTSTEETFTDSCRADYTSQPANSNSLGIYFTALPWHSNQNRPEQICWYFGDGRDTCINYTSSNPPPNGYSVYHLYNQSGNYNVCVRILYQGGCLSYYCRLLSVGEPDSCAANFQVLPSTSNALGKYFIAQASHNHNKKPVQICWQFGDNKDTCIQYPVNYTGSYAVFHLYTSPGNYNVCVSIHYDGGCVAYYCRIVEVVNSLDSCSANFQVIGSTANQLNKYFIAQPWNNHNKKPVRICWNFGDNRDTCITYPTNYTGQYAVDHIYLQPGNYNVCVTILYDGGCEAHYCRVVQVGDPDICAANFQVLAVSSTSLGKYFIAQPSNNHNKKPVRICWNFGDNRDTCIQYPTNYTGAYAVYHLYDSRGNYNVCVNILYDGGCEANYCRIVQVGNLEDSCSANFQVVSSSTNALNKYFIAQPWNNHNKKPVRVCWQFGDGRDTCIQYPTSYTGLYAVNHIYSHPDLYNVCVNILYDGGCEAHYCKQVQVGEPDSCTADFERIPSANANGLAVYLKALPWNNHNKKPSRICWQFGDGRDTCINYTETFTGQYVVSHTYAQPGQYEVCVNILYFGGCESRKCRNIIVPLPPDTCSVQMFETTPSINSLTRSFYALPVSSNTRRVESICWHFGDGRDTCINPTGINVIPIFYITHTYPGPGVYHACVNVIFAGGCTAERCIEVVIRSSVDICGGYFTDSLIGPRTFRFRGQSIQNPNDHAVSYNWSFGDGTSAVGQEVTHTFNQGGTYNACLLIRTAQGCETHICRPLLAGTNVAILQLSPNPVITNLHVVFISSFTETVNIRIVNSGGVAVRNYTRNAVTGSNVWDFDLTTLTPGIYSFVLQSPNQLASAIFLKQ